MPGRLIARPRSWSVGRTPSARRRRPRAGTGCQLLRELAAVLTAAVRDGDVAARLGGNAFAPLLPGTDRAGAVTTAEEVLAASRAVLPLRRASVSAGAATSGRVGTVDPERVPAAADRALHCAEAQGGDAPDAADDA